MVLPDSLLARLKEAAEIHSITELKKCLDEVQALGAEGRRLAAHLRELNQRFDMEGILTILGDIRHE